MMPIPGGGVSGDSNLFINITFEQAKHTLAVRDPVHCAMEMSIQVHSNRRMPRGGQIEQFTLSPPHQIGIKSHKYMMKTRASRCLGSLFSDGHDSLCLVGCCRIGTNRVKPAHFGTFGSVTLATNKRADAPTQRKQYPFATSCARVLCAMAIGKRFGHGGPLV